MDWMYTHHITVKPLSAGQKLAMMEKLKEAIREDNEKKKLEADRKFYGNQHVDSTPIGVNTKTDRSTWTDNQIAQKAKVGVGTVARYNRVMNSDAVDDELMRLFI